MNNPVGETARAAQSFMDALKGQPLSLALVVMNFALIGFVYFQSAQYTSQRSDSVKMLLQQQAEVQKLLSQCIVPHQLPGRPMVFPPPLFEKGSFEKEDDK